MKKIRLIKGKFGCKCGQQYPDFLFNDKANIKMNDFSALLNLLNFNIKLKRVKYECIRSKKSY